MNRFVLIAILGLAAVLGGCDRPSSVVSLKHASMLESPRPVAEFALVDQRGQTFSKAELRGRWTVLFSGFTHCPDTCPATLGLLKAVEGRLEGESIHRTVFVSVDPERDTPERLGEYLKWFDPSWTGVTGTGAELDALLDSLGMAHVRVPQGNDGYTMDHATAVVLINPDGDMVGYWKAPLDAAALAEDLGNL